MRTPFLLIPRRVRHTAVRLTRGTRRPCATESCASQRSLHNAPIFRLLLKVAVKGTHQCDFLNFCGAIWPQQDRMVHFVVSRANLQSPVLHLPIALHAHARTLPDLFSVCDHGVTRRCAPSVLTAAPVQRTNGKLTWLVLGGDPAARSHRVEQFTAL